MACPRIVLMGGFAGVGKTYIGRQMAKGNAAFLDKDTLCNDFTSAMLKTAGLPDSDRESAFYMTEVRPLEYKTLMQTAYQTLAASRKSVICVAPFISEFANTEWLQEQEYTAFNLLAHIDFVWVHADHDTIKTRLINRGLDRDAYKLAHWQDHQSGMHRASSAILPRLSSLTVIENNIAQDQSSALHDAIEQLKARWF